MASFPVKSFRYGLDVRKLSLETQPGTLSKLENAFINQGGEIEKRKAFALVGSLPAGCFGLENTSAGWVTFGSSIVANIDIATLTVMGITYQRLVFPPSVYGGNTPLAMVAVLYSTVFNGKAFVMAEWAGGQTFFFYDGSPVNPTWMGTVITGSEGNDVLVAQLAAELTTLGYATTLQSDGLSLYADTVPSVHVKPDLDWSSVSGFLGARLIGQNGGATAAVAASATFTITKTNTGDNGGVQVEAPQAVGGGNILLGIVADGTGMTATQVATAIALAINDLTWATGYTATSSVAAVSVYAPTLFGDFTSDLVVTDLGTGLTTADTGTPLPSLSLILTPPSLSVLVGGTKPMTVIGTIQASVSGAYTGSPSYKWEVVENTDALAYTIHGTNDSATATSVSFSKYLVVGSYVSATFKCTASTSDPLTSVKEFTVELGLENIN
jgi:hypothetical protein